MSGNRDKRVPLWISYKENEKKKERMVEPRWSQEAVWITMD
jgi:hypothetical protein